MLRRRPPLGVSAVVCLVLFVASCVGGDRAAGPGASGSVALAIQPVFGPAGASGPGAEINRIRLRVTELPSNTTLLESTLDVDPAAATWSVPLEIPLPPGRELRVTVSVLLIHVAPGGAETVEWSGTLGPLDLAPDFSTSALEVGVVRGPPENLSVTGVNIAPDPVPAIFVDQTVQLEARVTTNGSASAPPIVYWSSLDPTIAEVSGSGLVTPRALGNARIQALSGPAQDEAVVTIRERPREADLSLEKTVDDAAAFPGDTVVFRLVVRNLGPAAAAGVRVEDLLPSGLTLAQSRPGSATYDRTTGIWSVGGLAPGAAATLELDVVANAAVGTTVVNTARVLPLVGQVDPQPANDRAQASVRVQARDVDVSVTKTASPTSAQEGDTVRFTVRVANAGPAVANGIVVEEILGEGFTLVSATPARGTWDAVTRTWTVGTIGSGASATLTVMARVQAGTAGDRLSNTARYTGPAGQTDRNGANDSGQAFVQVGAPTVDLRVTKSLVGDSDIVAAGDTVRFTVTVRNLGPAGATGVTIDEDLPAGLSFAAATPQSGTYDQQTHVWSVGNLGADQSARLEVVTTVDVEHEGETLANRAHVGSVDQPDTNEANDEDEASVTVGGGGQPVDQSYSTPGNTELYVGGTGYDRPETPHYYETHHLLYGTPNLTVTNTDPFVTGEGGTVRLESNGYFSYVPQPGYTGTDEFEYTVNTGASATVTIEIVGQIWYVNNLAGDDGTGVSNDPFRNLSWAESESDIGDWIYVHAGDGSSEYYDLNLDLKDDQVLLGEAAGLSFDDFGELSAPGARPVITNTDGTAIDMASRNRVEGFAIEDVAGTAIRAIEQSDGQLSNLVISVNGGGALELVSTSGYWFLNEAHIEVVGFADGIVVDGGDPELTIELLPDSYINDGAGHALVVNGTTSGYVVIQGGPVTERGAGILIQNAGGDVEIMSHLAIQNTSGPGIGITGSSGDILFDRVAIETVGQNGIYTLANTGSIEINGDLTTEGAAGINFLSMEQTLTGPIDVDLSTYIVQNETDVDGSHALFMEGNPGTVEIEYLEVVSAGDEAEGAAIEILAGAGGTFRVTDPASTIVDSNGPGLSLSGGPVWDLSDHLTVDIALASLESSRLEPSFSGGIGLVDVDGTVVVDGGAISEADVGVLIDGGATSLQFGGAITNEDAGRPVDVRNTDGGLIVLNGAIVSADLGVLMENNDPGTTLLLVGGLDLETGANPGLVATGGGTLGVAQGSNTIATTTARAVDIQDVAIHMDDVTLESVTASAPANFTVFLSNTGPDGALVITGDGDAGDSGGVWVGGAGGSAALSATSASLDLTTVDVTVASSTVGLSILNAHAVSLNEVSVTTTSGTGTGLAFSTTETHPSSLDITSSTFSGWATGARITAAGNAEVVAGIESSSFSDNVSNGLYARSLESGVLELDISGSVFANQVSGFGLTLETVASGSVAVTSFGDGFNGNGARGISIATAGTGELELALEGATVSGNADQGVYVQAGTDSHVEVEVIGGTFEDQTSGILGSLFDRGTIELAVEGVTFTNHGEYAVFLGVGPDAETATPGGYSVDFTGNTIDGVSDGGGFAAAVAEGTHAFEIDENVVNDVSGFHGLHVRNEADGASDWAVRLASNDVTMNESGRAGIALEGRGGSVACWDIRDNTVASGSDWDDILLEHGDGELPLFNIERLLGGSGFTTDDALIATEVATDNTGDPSVHVDLGGRGATGVPSGACATFSEDENDAPVADVGGPYQALVGEDVTLDGSNSTDPDGSIVSFEFTVEGDALALGGSDQAVYTCIVAGTFEAQLVVRDNRGVTDAATVDIECTPVVPPIQVGAAVATVLTELSVRTAVATRELFASGGLDVITESQSGGDFTVAESAGLWTIMDIVLQLAENSIISQAGALPATRAEAFIWAGYAYRIAAENFCQVAFDGDVNSHLAAFERAESYFTDALAVDPGGPMTNVAYAGRAAARQVLGNDAGATADAAQVPNGFSLSASYSTDGPVNQIALHSSNSPYRTLSVWNTPWEENFTTLSDPRTPWSDDPDFPFGDEQRPPIGDVPWYYQTKYTSEGSDVRLASGWEMVLVRAEAAIRANNIASAYALMNTVRAANSLAPLTAGTVAQAWTDLIRERGAQLWLEGRRLGDVRRWAAGGFDQFLNTLEDPDNPATYLDSGRDLCIPIP